MRQYLKNEVFKVSKWVELFISAIIMIAVIGGTIYLVKDVVQLMMNYPTSRDIYKFVGVAFNLVICIEFVKMLCKHTPDTLVEVMMFAIARQMIVEHLNVYETLVGIGAIAALFAIRKFLFCSFDEADHMICRGSQTVAHANLITGARIPEEKNRLLRNVVSDNLQKEGKNVAIGACVYYKDCALRVDSMKEGVVTRVEVIKNL